jgi:hypothetical protein
MVFAAFRRAAIDLRTISGCGRDIKLRYTVEASRHLLDTPRHHGIMRRSHVRPEVSHKDCSYFTSPFACIPRLRICACSKP